MNIFYSYTKRKVQDPGRSDRWWTNPQGRGSNHSNGQTSCLLRLSYGKLPSVGLKTLQHLIQRFAKLLKMVIILFVVSRPRHVWWNRISLLRSRLPQIVSLLYTPFLLGEGEFKYCPLGFNHVGNVNKWINVFLNLIHVALDLPLVELWKPSTERKKADWASTAECEGGDWREMWFPVTAKQIW